MLGRQLPLPHMSSQPYKGSGGAAPGQQPEGATVKLVLAAATATAAAAALGDEHKPQDTNLVGTPHYMSPELLSCKAYGFKTDVWWVYTNPSQGASSCSRGLCSQLCHLGQQPEGYLRPLSC
jgi:serine/threonine protein kinase